MGFLSVYMYFMIAFVKLLFPRYWFTSTTTIWNQARVETGNFTSRIFREYNNLFGMRHPSVRPTTSLGRKPGEDELGQAYYSSRFSSIYDYFLRQKYFKISPRNPQYITDTVKSGYAAHPNYKQMWESMNAKPNLLKVTAYLLLFLPLIFIAYLMYLKRQ